MGLVCEPAVGEALKRKMEGAMLLAVELTLVLH